MKKLISGLCGLLVWVLVNPAGALTLSLQPATQFAGMGDNVSVDLVIDGLGDFAPDSLGDFDVLIRYDSGLLTFQGYTLGPFLGDELLGEAVDVSLGQIGSTVNVAELSLLEPDAATCVFCIPPYLDDIQPGSFTLATFEFTSNLLPGQITFIDIREVFALGDGFGNPLVLDAVVNARVLAPIPVPAAVWLFGSGLIGLIGIARKKKT